MKNIVHINRDQLLKALRKHDELLKDDPHWKEEKARFEEQIKQEKLQRDTAIAQKGIVEPPGNREGK